MANREYDYQDAAGNEYTITGCPVCYAKEHEPKLFGVSMFNWYTYYKEGVLPESGGMLDQPNLYIDLLNIVLALVDETEMKQRQKLKDRNKNNG